MSSGNEIVTIVDEHNRPVGEAPRWRMRSQGLLHRATYIFVFSSDGEVFVHKRTATKDVYPGYDDAAAGGVVTAGESYESSAVRELEEELGLENVPLAQEFDFYHEDGRNRCWGRVYTCRHDGPFRLQAAEIEHGRFAAVDQVLDGTVAPVTPDSLQALRRLVERPSIDHP